MCEPQTMNKTEPKHATCTIRCFQCEKRPPLELTVFKRLELFFCIKTVQEHGIKETMLKNGDLGQGDSFPAENFVL